MSEIREVEFVPLNSEHWVDFEELFGERGACGGCWCMWWRLTRSGFIKQKGEGNRKAMKQMVDSGEVPGILALVDDKAVGWCSVGPREVFPALERSRTLKPIDDKPVWSIVCLFIAKPFRRKGLSRELLKAAVKYARKRGAKIVEGYPTDSDRPQPDAFVYTGLASAFRKVGFKEAGRQSRTRPIMRYAVGGE